MAGPLDFGAAGGFFGGAGGPGSFDPNQPSFGISSGGTTFGGTARANRGGTFSNGGRGVSPEFSADGSSVTLPEISVTTPPPPSNEQVTPTTPGTAVSTDGAGPAVVGQGAGDNSFGPGLTTSGGNDGVGVGSGTGSDTGSGDGDGSGFGSGSGGGGGGGGGGSSGGGFLPNPLNAVAQPTYHFTFSAKGEGSGGQGTIIIAETGRTGFNIKDVKIRSVVAPNSETINTVITGLDITILEPVGTSFLDALYLSCAQSGVNNWQKTTYLLELYFMGYQESGQPVQRITEGMPNGGQFKWEIVINNINTSLDITGGTYVLECTLLHDVSHENEWKISNGTYQPKGDTVKEVLDDLTKQINKDIQKQYGTDIITYSYQFHKGKGEAAFDIGSAKTRIKDTMKFDPMRMNPMGEDKERDKFQANVKRGFPLARYAEDIIAVTKEGQALIALGKQSGDVDAPPDGKFVERIAYRAIPEIKFGAYHAETGQYKKTVTYHIKPFKTQTMNRHADETRKPSAAAWQAVKDRMRKHYDYMYTGLNTEVTNFDIKFSFAWNAGIPPAQGWDYYSYMVEHHAIYDKEGQKKKKDQSSGKNNNSQAPSASQGGGGGGGAKYAEDLLANGNEASSMFTAVSLAQSAEASRRAGGSGMMGQRGSKGRSIYGAMLDQLYGTSTLIEINLSIRGDPFWLGGKYEDNFGDGGSDQNAPDWPEGDTGFLLIFKYPSGIHEATGQPKLSQTNAFSGAYRVTKVESEFSEGRFLQTLEAKRLDKIDPSTINQAGGGSQVSSGGFGIGGNAFTSTAFSPGSTTNDFGVFGLNQGGFTALQPTAAAPVSSPTSTNVSPSPSSAFGATTSGVGAPNASVSAPAIGPSALSFGLLGPSGGGGGFF